MHDSEYLKRLESKIDRLDERLDSVDRTLLVNTKSLEDHVKRTNLLESTIKPLTAHVEFMNAAAKVIAVLASALLLAEKLGLVQLIK